jgi:hypothetical protein
MPSLLRSLHPDCVRTSLFYQIHLIICDKASSYCLPSYCPLSAPRRSPYALHTIATGGPCCCWKCDPSPCVDKEETLQAKLCDSVAGRIWLIPTPRVLSIHRRNPSRSRKMAPTKCPQRDGKHLNRCRPRAHPRPRLNRRVPCHQCKRGGE